ncbi:hypothetical protein [Sinimarinibacterium thermocellulolyticum]|uniref:Uncharacterized protein n=1 Tax=Sinimarinibacterium thermocellulolyticum TaxID=3170016 RepID=A0ABV2A946_9GAMM
MKRLEEAEDCAWAYYTPYENAGRAIFSFPSALVQMLMHSAVDDVPTTLIRAPYDSLFIHFGVEAGIRSALTGLPLDGVYVDIDSGPNGGISLWATPVAPWMAEAPRWSFLKRIQEDHKLGYFECRLGFDDGTTFGEILAAPFENPYTGMTEFDYWRQERRAKDALASSGYEYTIKPHREAITTWTPDEECVIWREQTDQLARLVVNALLYLVYDKREVELDYPAHAPRRLAAQARSTKPTEARRATSKLASMGYRKVYLCGRHFKSPTIGDGATSLSAHWRRGHWRQQACGPELRDHKLIWIMPTLVNAGAGQMIHGHIYEAGERQKARL